MLRNKNGSHASRTINMMIAKYSNILHPMGTPPIHVTTKFRR